MCCIALMQRVGILSSGPASIIGNSNVVEPQDALESQCHRKPILRSGCRMKVLGMRCSVFPCHGHMQARRIEPCTHPSRMCANIPSMFAMITMPLATMTEHKHRLERAASSQEKSAHATLFSYSKHGEWTAQDLSMKHARVGSPSDLDVALLSSETNKFGRPTEV